MVKASHASVGSPPGRASRRVALDLFTDALTEGLALDDAEARRADRVGALAPRDRAFARRLAITALRRLGEVDAAIDARLAKPLPKKSIAARMILRLAVAEVLATPGSAHAAVDAAVGFAKRADARLSGLVNAVARKIAAESPIFSSDEAARLNTPDWLWDRLVAERGPSAAAAVAQGHGRGAALDLTARDPAEAALWAGRLGGALTPTGSIRLRAAGAVSGLDGYDAGAWWVQDAAAALPARLLGRPTAAAATALDMCAAPGGKTLQLASAGWRVTAIDRSSARLERLRANLERTGLDAETVAEDAVDWTDERLFDAVLLDAPCSASGTVRRHPELPHRRDADALDALTALQDRLLDAAWRRLAPGGVLVYCVCSLFDVEGPARASAFEARTRDAAREPATASEVAVDAEDGLEPVRPLIDAAGALRTSPADWPDLGGVDGFFAARFRKAPV